MQRYPPGFVKLRRRNQQAWRIGIELYIGPVEP
jgi:hypothetical protein